MNVARLFSVDGETGKYYRVTAQAHSPKRKNCYRGIIPLRSSSDIAVLLRHNVRVVGDGPQTIVFAHGFGTDQNVWKAQVAAFQSRCRCVLFDHAGSGSSDLSTFNPRRYSSLYSYASDLVEICAALKLRQVALAGHSVSGMVSLLASLLNPDLFGRIAIIGASPRYLNDPATGYHGGFEQDQIDALFDAMAASYQSWASGFAPLVMGNSERPQLASYYCESLMAIRPDVAQAVLRVIFSSDHRAELPRVRALVHVLQSHDDMAVPDTVGEYLAAHIENAKLVKLEASGHLPHVSAPGAVNQAIADLLSL